MSLLPTKYIPIETSLLGVSAIVRVNLRANDTVSTLWDRVSEDGRVRTFERFCDALTLLYCIRVIESEGGTLRAVVPPTVLQARRPNA